MRSASNWLIAVALCATGAWPASAQTPSTPGEAHFVAEAHWGELVAQDAALRSAGVTLPRKADGPERELPGPRSIEVGPDGALVITPLKRLEELEAGQGVAAGADVEEDVDLSFAAAGASPRMLANGLANLDTQDTFQALPDNNQVIPPDTMGAIGANHLFTMLNSQVRIQNRDGSIVSTVALGTFWSPVASSGVFDPRVFYDNLSNRFVAVALRGAFSSASALLVAVSASADPTGVWRFFIFDADAANVDFADFPDAGYNNRWVAVTANMFTIAGGAFSGVKMWVFEKDSLFAPSGGVPVHTFPTGFAGVPLPGQVFSFALRPAHTHDAAEDTLHIVDFIGFTRSSNGQPLMRISRITGATDSPVWSVMPGSVFGASTGLFDYPVKFNPFTVAAGQSGTLGQLDTIGTRMLDAEFRNGAIWTANAGGLPAFTSSGDQTTPNRTASVWTQIDPTNTSTPFIQGGLIAGAVGEHFFVPSIAVNRANDVLVGFTHSSPNVFARAGYSGRLATDLLGGTRAPVFYKAGEAAYDKPAGAGVDRWGDYSQTSVDPKDDRTFWTIQEYAETPAGPTSLWGTWWARVGFVSCPPDLDGDGTVGPSDLLQLLSGFGLFFGPGALLDLLAAFGADCPTQTP